LPCRQAPQRPVLLAYGTHDGVAPRHGQWFVVLPWTQDSRIPGLGIPRTAASPDEVAGARFARGRLPCPRHLAAASRSWV